MIDKGKLHWYTVRVTYGREKKANEYFVSKKINTFYPTINTVKVVDGKKKTVVESRLPNIIFVYGTEEELKQYIYDNVNIPYLRFYYRYYHEGSRIKKEPLIIPDSQIESFKIICASEAKDIVVDSVDVTKFKKGQRVRVIEGPFKGVEGLVARWHGQQRVAVVIEGLFSVATAYVPTSFLEKQDNNV